MGRSAQEGRRLQLQAEMYAPHTEHLFRLAGIGPGMTVVDVGCGPGDVTRLLARMVGPSGFVTGIDMDPAVLRVAARDAATAAWAMYRSGKPHCPTCQLNSPSMRWSGA